MWQEGVVERGAKAEIFRERQHSVKQRSVCVCVCVCHNEKKCQMIGKHDKQYYRYFKSQQVQRK